MANATIEEFVRKYLKEGRMLQIATVDEGQPWSCTVYYASDEDLNIYWISEPNTRHSREIQKHSKVAGSIPIKFDDLIVIGVQLEGDAELVKSTSEIKEKLRLYSDKFNRGMDWYESFVAGKNEYKLYRIRPRLFVIFDRVNFPENNRQEWEL
ncbi:pyridoxamine 5'-phosphate oxidase family protein [Candidatus Woesearchaeota archaeon]|nr:pyridoxamine 5'-phosphate oxidase family protein [Candidatus Woesearchaeota archaeon]